MNGSGRRGECLPELEVIVSVAIAAIIGLVVFLLLRSEVRAIKGGLEKVDAEMPRVAVKLQALEDGVSHVGELVRSAEVPQIKATLEAFGQEVATRIDAIKRLSSEEMARVRDDITKLAEEKAVKSALDHVSAVAVMRDEFDRLREQVSKIGGSEEAPERLDIVTRIFANPDLKVLAWQCKLIRLAENGLAPEAEEDLLLSEGVPVVSAREFLKKLRDLQVLSAKKVESYWLGPDFLWLLSYVQDPAWLQRQLGRQTMREVEYQQFVRDHVGEVEEGLIVIAEQYDLPSGKVDILARDRAGIEVVLELKYPVASSAIVGQLLRYREDLRRKTASGNIRCVAIAPRVPERVQQSLQNNLMEYRELQFEAAM